VHSQHTKCTPRQSKSQFLEHFLEIWRWESLDFSSFRLSFDGDEQKRSSTFLRKKLHPRQNPGYAPMQVRQLRTIRSSLPMDARCTVAVAMGWRPVSSHRPTYSSENFCVRAYTTLTLTLTHTETAFYRFAELKNRWAKLIRKIVRESVKLSSVSGKRLRWKEFVE